MNEELLQALAREYRSIRGSKGSARRCGEIYAELEKAVGPRVTDILRSPRKKIAPPNKDDFQTLRSQPGYSINRFGAVLTPTGGFLTPRWSWFKFTKAGAERLANPIESVRFPSGERAVYWLLVEAGFEEHPRDTDERRQERKRDRDPHIPRDVHGVSLRKRAECYNDMNEARAEDPELFGFDEDGEEVQ
jgi:hypothetical protein